MQDRQSRGRGVDQQHDRECRRDVHERMHWNRVSQLHASQKRRPHDMVEDDEPQQQPAESVTQRQREQRSQHREGDEFLVGDSL